MYVLSCTKKSHQYYNNHHWTLCMGRDTDVHCTFKKLFNTASNIDQADTNGHLSDTLELSVKVCLLGFID